MSNVSLADNNILSWNTSNDQMLCPLCRYTELLKKLLEYLSHFLGSILMNYMSNLINDHQLKFALHLSNSQFFIHAVTSCQEKLLRDSHIEEAFGEALKPAFPVRLGGHQISSPNVFGVSSIICLAHYLMWHGHSSTFYVFYCARFYTILYDTGKWFELWWPRHNYILHKRKCIHGRPFNYINNEKSLQVCGPLLGFIISSDTSWSFSGDWTSHGVSNQNDWRFFKHFSHVLENFDCISN